MPHLSQCNYDHGRQQAAREHVAHAAEGPVGIGVCEDTESEGTRAICVERSEAWSSTGGFPAEANLSMWSCSEEVKCGAMATRPIGSAKHAEVTRRESSPAIHVTPDDIERVLLQLMLSLRVV